MQYVTVFEITQKPFQWWFPASGLIFVLIGIILIRTPGLWANFKPNFKESLYLEPQRDAGASQKRTKRMGYIFVVFASLWVVLVFGFMFSEYREYLTTYRNGNYSVVEGRVENFRELSVSFPRPALPRLCSRKLMLIYSIRRKLPFASAKHMARYVNEFAFRLNDGNVRQHVLLRLNALVDACVGKRITYAALTA